MQPQALIYFDISHEHPEPAFIQIGYQILVVSAMAVSFGIIWVVV